MDLCQKIIDFYKNAGHNKLCLTSVPSLCAIIIAEGIFNSYFFAGIFIMIACIFFQISVQIFDDYIDWIFSKTQKRLELEKTGIRGLYTKSVHFLSDKKLPRKYFYLAILFAIIAIAIFIADSIIFNNYMIILFLLPPLLFFLINYCLKFKKILNFTGTEFLCAISCSFLTMFCVFYASAKCITMPLAVVALILFFLIYNLLYTASLLNLKPDIMTEKSTMPIILKNENIQFLFSVFLTLFPFVILPIAVYYEILPKFSLTAEFLIFHSVWFLYLIYLYIKAPQKIIKWHFLMGLNKNEVENEQKNIGWYTVRYNLFENIFLIFSLILIITFILQQRAFIY